MAGISDSFKNSIPDLKNMIPKFPTFDVPRLDATPGPPKRCSPDAHVGDVFGGAKDELTAEGAVPCSHDAYGARLLVGLAVILRTHAVVAVVDPDLQSPGTGCVREDPAACGTHPYVVQTDCVLDVLMQVTDLEADSTATLTVDCDGVSQDVPLTLVNDDELVFPGITLAHGAQCTLSVTATDTCAQAATAGPISVTVDRVAPILSDSNLPDILVYTDDQDPVTDGLQYPVQVQA